MDESSVWIVETEYNESGKRKPLWGCPVFDTEKQAESSATNFSDTEARYPIGRGMKFRVAEYRRVGGEDGKA